jgi:hypothetical protein
MKASVNSQNYSIFLNIIHNEVGDPQAEAEIMQVAHTEEPVRMSLLGDIVGEQLGLLIGTQGVRQRTNDFPFLVDTSNPKQPAGLGLDECLEDFSVRCSKSSTHD